MYPEIGPGTRFFFFNELRESAKKNEEAKNFLANAEAVVFGGPNLLDEKIQQQSLLNNTELAIDFLENMAQFEAENEQRVFEQQLLPIINSNPDYSQFKDIYSNHSVDYPRLLVLINTINQNIEEVKASFFDLKKSTTNFNEAAHKIIKEKKYNYTEIERNRGQLVTDARILAQEMGLKINSNIAEIGASLSRDMATEEKAIEARGLQLIEENVLNMIKNGQNKKFLSSNATVGLKSMLQSKLREIAQAHTESQGAQTQLKEILNKIEQSKDLEQEVITELITYANQLLEQINIIETRGQQIQKLINRGQKEIHLQNGKILGLTVQTRNKIDNFLQRNNKEKILINEQLKNSEEYKSILNQNVQAKYIQQLREALDMQEASLDDLIIEINQILKQMQQSTRKESITIMTESRSANLLYNLIPDNVIKDVILDAMENGKNDATLHFLGKAFYDSGLDQDFNQIISAELNDFSKYYKKYLKQIEPNKSVKSFNVKTQTMAVEEIENNIINDIEAELNGQRLTTEQIKDIFIIDSSVKFAETFIADEGGFHGGSLGSDLEHQIDNINTMLNYGGITIQDANWLITAVLNAGNGMIGSSQRPALENYFSTTAAMLMFRTGGNTIKQWKEQVQHSINTSPTKIHIYTFGTLFVPQSYILKLTAEGLRKCNNLLTQEADDSGSRAHIYNPVTSKNKKETFEATAAENYPKVNIQLTLLGGFLDMLHQMEEIMNNLPF